MLVRRLASLGYGLAALVLMVGLFSAPSTASAETTGGTAAQTALQSSCTLYSLVPYKVVSGSPYVQGNATATCNYTPRSCTYHVVLQELDPYYHTWVQLVDRWYYTCPTPVNSTKTMYSPLYRCPLGSRDIYRTVLTAATDGYNNQVISYNRTISC